MRARITKSFLAGLSLIGLLTLPAVASAHDHENEDYYDSRGEVHRELHRPLYTEREDLYLQHLPRQDHRDSYGRYSYNDDNSRGRWYGRQPQYGNTYSRGDGCKWPRRSYENGRQYRPRYYGNDYYGYAR